PNTGTNYYRLKQMDFDGSFEYSNIVSVTIENDKGISIQPNLVKDNIKLVVKKGYSKEQSIQIYNIVGAKVLEARLPAGTLQKTIDVHHLQSGHYFVRVNTNEEPKVLRFVKM
ncbi:MAG TPA: T9SS type A sorting domain-containing protein, partial [Saprospiraceae bacterium]|nr:T9SS type A sorting domain-containing protein [Saprospiraceae bacterium]